MGLKHKLNPLAGYLYRCITHRQVKLPSFPRLCTLQLEWHIPGRHIKSVEYLASYILCHLVFSPLAAHTRLCLSCPDLLLLSSSTNLTSVSFKCLSSVEGIKSTPVYRVPGLTRAISYLVLFKCAWF